MNWLQKILVVSVVNMEHFKKQTDELLSLSVSDIFSQFTSILSNKSRQTRNMVFVPPVY